MESIPPFELNRPQGNLKWAQIAAGGKLSYQDALTFNFNASITDYLLNNNFGTSESYGVSLLPNPSMYSKAQFASGLEITVGSIGSFWNLGAVGGKSPVKGTNLNSQIAPAKVIPGTFNQVVQAERRMRNYWHRPKNFWRRKRA